jgi:nicotinamidase-related amidase
MGKLLSPPGPGTVHLCIDMQNLFAAGAPWGTPWLDRVIPLGVALVEHAAARTVFTRFIPPQSKKMAVGVWKAYYEKWECVTRERLDPHMLELAPPLARFVPPAGVIDRQSYCAFGNGRLQTYLEEHHVDTLIFSGGETDVCVLASVLAAVDRGYRVILAKDALCSSADETHDAVLDLFTKRFDLQIEVAATEDILALWQGP